MSREYYLKGALKPFRVKQVKLISNKSSLQRYKSVIRSHMLNIKKLEENWIELLGGEIKNAIPYLA